MENNPLLNLNADFLSAIPDNLAHFNELLSVLSNQKQLDLSVIALNELILVYLQSDTVDDTILKQSLLLFFLLHNATSTVVTSVDASNLG